MQPLVFLTMATAPSGLVSDDETREPLSTNPENPFDVERAHAAKNPANGVTEWTLLVKLATGAADNDINIVTIHRDIIALMRENNLTLSIKTLDGSIITTDADFPTGNDYKVKFAMKENKTQFTVAHTVFSMKPLEAIKRNNKILLDLLGKTNVYLD